MDDQLREDALDYHRLPTPGKISVTPTKGLLNQRDLSLAYTPGVAAACELIVADPAEAGASLHESRAEGQNYRGGDLTRRKGRAHRLGRPPPYHLLSNT